MLNSRLQRNEVAKMKKAIVYIHGRGGSSEEAKHYEPLFPECTVLGFDYKSQNPWEAKKEFPHYFDSLSDEYQSITIIANSIGAFFAMCSLSDRQIERAFFISPVLDMQKLITDMMELANVSEEELRTKGIVYIGSERTLSWEYLTYVREHPYSWEVQTEILYGSRDELTSINTVRAFVEAHHASLTVMDGGEHWFHTEEQMQFLDDWIKGIIELDC